MKLIDDGICDGFAGMGISVVFPSGRICRGQIENHASLAIDTGGPGIGVTGFADMSVHKYTVSIVYAIQIAYPFGYPGSLYVCTHTDLTNQIICIRISAAVEIYKGFFRGRGPKTENSFIGKPGCAKVTAGIGIFFFKGLAGVEIVHSDITSVFIVSKIIP
jgi:hypothetical protein